MSASRCRGTSKPAAVAHASIAFSFSGRRRNEGLGNLAIDRPPPPTRGRVTVVSSVMSTFTEALSCTPEREKRMGSTPSGCPADDGDALFAGSRAAISSGSARTRSAPGRSGPRRSNMSSSRSREDGIRRSTIFRSAPSGSALRKNDGSGRVLFPLNGTSALRTRSSNAWPSRGRLARAR